MLGFGRLVGWVVFSYLALSSLSACERDRDCYGFVDNPPTFLLVDRVGDDGVPFYDTSILGPVEGADGPLPSCGGFDGLTTAAQLTFANVRGGNAGQCEPQVADADVGTNSITHSRANVAGVKAWLARGRATLVTAAETVSIEGCIGEWYSVIGALYTGFPPDDPGEGALPPWTVARAFFPGTGTGCAGLVACGDVFTARIVPTP